MLSMSSKFLPFNIPFTFRNRKMSLGARSGDREGVPAQLLVYWLKAPTQTVL
jgi:hypothetical protein